MVDTMLLRCPGGRLRLKLVLALALALPCSWTLAAPATTAQEPTQLAGLPLPDIRLPDIRDIPLPRPTSVSVHLGWYLPFHNIGFKVGSMVAAFDDNSVRDCIGFTSSGDFIISPISIFTLEMELLGTTSLPLFSGNSNDQGWSAVTFGIYGAFRFGDPVYFKVRGGWMAKSVYTDTPNDRVENDRSAFPIGVGIGWRIGANHAMEIESTRIDQDLSMVSFIFIL